MASGTSPNWRVPSFIQGNLFFIENIAAWVGDISGYYCTVREKYEKAEGRKEKEMEERENK